MEKVENAQIPDYFKPLFWSYNFSKLDLVKDKKTIIIQAINYGDLKHWKWLVDKYGQEEIRSILQIVPATEIRDRVKNLITIMFNISNFNYAPRSSN